MSRKAKKTNQSDTENAPKVIDVAYGHLVEFKKPLSSEMLNESGLVTTTGLNSVNLRFDRRYVIGKIKHDFIESLQLTSKDEIISLVNEACQASFNRGVA